MKKKKNQEKEIPTGNKGRVRFELIVDYDTRKWDVKFENLTHPGSKVTADILFVLQKVLIDLEGKIIDGQPEGFTTRLQ